MRLLLHLAGLFLRGTALMFGLVGAVAGLACLGGAFSIRLDALTHLAPLWLACGLAALVLGAAFSREGERWAIVGLAAVAIISIGLLVTPELLASAKPKAVAQPGRAVKVVQFNAWTHNDSPYASRDWLLAQKADIVLVEEGAGDAWPILQGLRKAYPNHTHCRFRYGCDSWVFSRWPIVEERTFRESGQDLSGVWATLDHPGGRFTVAATHFVWPFPAGPQQVQSRMLVADLKSLPQDDLILTGDFNSTPWSFTLRRQDKALGLERRTRALASWPAGKFSRVASAPFPSLPIDHVYAGKAWKTVSVRRGPVLGSDHRPVVAVLTR
ncbi:MAG: endonuclease/exonuclease/phosphatase family protein [Caulobacter sp.]|nr:endonuclease/exonuclease/phosphatase family protein [Caulobacter sp.]